MHLGKILLAAGAMAAAALFALPAQAEVVTASALNVRDAPGGRVIGVLYGGDNVRVVGRSGGWCEIALSGRDGWVACSYLAGGSDRDRGRDRDRDRDRAEPNVSIDFSIPGFSFSIGGGDFDRPGRPGRPGFPGRGGEVCFYEHVNYGGASFCVDPGERIRALGAWNDRISSIRVRGGAQAQVCEHDNFQGRCIVVDRSRNNLGQRGNDIISSIRVR